MKINYKQAYRVVAAAHDAFHARFGLLANIEDLVESQVPVGVTPGSPEHAAFLFYIVFNDHGIRSNRLYSRAKAFYSTDPEMFSPFLVSKRFSSGNDHTLISKISGLSVRYPREAAKSWYINSLKIINEYSGKPSFLFSEYSDARDLLSAIQSFRGYGPKTGGMLLRAVVGLGYSSPTHLDQVLVPVDIHDSRISFYTGICSVESAPGVKINYTRYVVDIQKVLREACRESGYSWLDVDRALWLIGSRGCAKGSCRECPLLELCVEGTDRLKLGHKG